MKPFSNLRPVRRRKYLAVFNHWLALLQIVEEFGDDLEMSKVAIAVNIGYLEGRPMDISALATYLSIPRTTVHRKVEKLVRDWAYTVSMEGARALPLFPENYTLKDTFISRSLRTIRVTINDLLEASEEAWEDDPD